MREHKYRAWDKKYKKMYYGDIRIVLAYPHKDIVRMEYTGLKAKNGEIYEGDVVAINGGANPIKTEVFFEDGCYCVKMLDNTCELKYYTEMQFCETEIIGNIYENPELLPKPGKE